MTSAPEPLGFDRRFQKLLEAAPDAMLVVDEKGLITLVNAQTEILFGYEREDLLGKPIEMLIPERFRAHHPALRAHYGETPRRRPMGMANPKPAPDSVPAQLPTLYALRKDGSEFPVEISLSPSDDGEMNTIAAVRDVSDRLRAERAQDHLAAVVECSSDAIISRDLHGIIITWNPGAVRLYGYEAEEAIGRSITIIGVPGHEDETNELVVRLLHGERVEHFHTRRRRKDGHIIDISLTLSLIRDARGKAYGVSAIARDITADKQAEHALRNAKIAAENAKSELETFSYSVAHDLRAPLRSMRGFGEILLNDHAASLLPKAQDYLRRIVNASDRMGQVIDALLRLSRLGKSELHCANVNLSALCESIAGQQRLAHPGREVEVVIQPNLTVYADPSMIRAALENLLANAWKFTAGQKRARIELTSLERDGEIVYVVRDNGAGFDMAFANKLFIPFQRLHSAAEFPGTGIGLATVHRIIQRHGGRIWAEGAVNAGAFFYFTLPPPDETSEAQPSQPGLAEGAHHG